MAESHRIETFPSDGRQVLRWEPTDPESVERARAEFERLKAEGYALFALEEQPGRYSVEKKTTAFEANGGAVVARSTRPAVPVQTDEFRPEATRVVAVRPVRGGA